jgi:hypothetical protein
VNGSPCRERDNLQVSVGTLIIKDVIFYSSFWFDARRVLAKFHASAMLHRCTVDTRFAKIRWDVGPGWCLGIYAYEDMHDVLEVKTNLGLRKHGLANLTLEPF